MKVIILLKWKMCARKRSLANSRHYPSIPLLRLMRATNASVMMVEILTLTFRSMCFHGQCTDVMTEFVYNYYERPHILRHKCK